MTAAMIVFYGVISGGIAFLVAMERTIIICSGKVSDSHESVERNYVVKSSLRTSHFMFTYQIVESQVPFRQNARLSARAVFVSSVKCFCAARLGMDFPDTMPSVFDLHRTALF